jgi:hypothetical protein
VAVIYSAIAGVLWWIDLASRNNVNWLEAFAISSAAIGGPLFLALLVAGLGHFLRLFVLYVSSTSTTNTPSSGRTRSDDDPTVLALAAIAVARRPVRPGTPQTRRPTGQAVNCRRRPGCSTPIP